MSLKIVLYSAEWCKWCKQIKPIWQQLIDKYNDRVEFEMVDVDTLPPEKHYELKIKSIPEMRFFVPDDDEPVASLGVLPTTAYEAMIESLL